jgi:hypothetical protein
VLLNRNEVGFRQRENQRDRLDLGDVNEAVHIGRVNDIADIDLLMPVTPSMGEVRSV